MVLFLFVNQNPFYFFEITNACHDSVKKGNWQCREKDLVCSLVQQVTCQNRVGKLGLEEDSAKSWYSIRFMWIYKNKPVLTPCSCGLPLCPKAQLDGCRVMQCVQWGCNWLQKGHNVVRTSWDWENISARVYLLPCELLTFCLAHGTWKFICVLALFPQLATTGLSRPIGVSF